MTKTSEGNFTLPPTHKGTYILILSLRESTQLTIGKLGTFTFAAGFYAYIGSAFGSGGLRGRLKHHLKPVVNLHWHIDYLRQAATVCEVWYLASETVYEHQWADVLSSMPSASIPAHRFGASDCHCEAHLMYFPQKPEFDNFCEKVGESLQCLLVG